MTVTILAGPTIAAGASLSDAIDCTGRKLVRLIGPAGGWTPAMITFQSSHDNILFNNLFDSATGLEVAKEMSGDNNGYIFVDPMYFNWIKIRSGYSRQPILQVAQRIFTLAVSDV
jgi:hypothetical protein